MQTEKNFEPNPTARLVLYWEKMAKEWEDLGKLDEAGKYYQKAFKISEQVFGEVHPQTIKLSAKLEMRVYSIY